MISLRQSPRTLSSTTVAFEETKPRDAEAGGEARRPRVADVGHDARRGRRVGAEVPLQRVSEA